MSQKYIIYYIDPSQIIPDKEIGDGMLRKDWYDHPALGECLFKEARPSQALISEARTDWSEKVVNEIANLLNLPVAHYELATGYFEESTELVEGVISINCIPNNANVLTGEEFLSENIDYNSDDPSQYTIENVLKGLDSADVKPPCNWENQIPEIDTGAKLFVGYMLLDAFVTNSDRHDHNWSVMSVDDRLELVPSFDHGISLGSTDEDEDKPSISLPDYVDRYSQSCFQEGYNKLPTLEVFNRAGKLYPEAAQIWLEKLRAITPEQIDEIFERIPEGRITPVSAKFAQDLIAYNRTELLQTYQTELDSNSSLITFSDINNYRDYLKSKEYKQQLPPAERGDLGRKAGEIIDPLMNQFRTIARAEAGEFLPAPHPYFQSFKTEMDLSEQDRIGIEKARDWARRQPVAPIEEEDRSRGLDR